MPLIYLDIETDNSEGYNGLDVFNGRIVTIQMLMPSGKVVILKDPTQKQMDEIKPILESNVIVGHNLKFDCKFLKQQFGITVRHVYDTYIAEIIISGGMYANGTYRAINKIGMGLKDLAFKYCGAKMDKGEQVGFMYGVPLTMAQRTYAANDLRYLPVIMKCQMDEIKNLKLERTVGVEMRCLPAMVWLELSGFKVNVDKIRSVEVELKRRVAIIERKLFPVLEEAYKAAMEKEITEAAENTAIRKKKFDMQFSLTSSTKTLKALKQLGYDIEITNEDCLAPFKKDKVIKLLLLHREATHFLTTYVNSAFDREENGQVIRGYVHPNGRTYSNFKQYGTETGRLSCGNENLKKLPVMSLNLQNQPKKLGWRSVFVAEEGYVLLTSDYSQIEPRIMAQVSGDPKMIDAYATGKDIYRITAEAIFGIPYDKVKKESREREIAKQITLGLCYGLGTPGLIKKLKTESGINLTQDEAKLYINKFKKNYPTVTRFLDETGNKAVKYLVVRNVNGRIRRFSPVKFGEEWKIVNQAKNAVIQSLSADITKIAMGNLCLLLESRGVRFVNTVHDEIVLESPVEIADEVSKILEDEMVKAGKLFLTEVPCKSEVTPSQVWKK